MALNDIKNNIAAKKTTELVLLFHKKIIKLVFLQPNMGQMCFKVLIIYQSEVYKEKLRTNSKMRNMMTSIQYILHTGLFSKACHC